MTAKKTISTEEFDRIFDEGEEDIMEYLDLSSAVRINHGTRKINVDMPAWVVDSLDAEARRIGVSRQAVIKMWLVERLDEEARRSA